MAVGLAVGVAGRRARAPHAPRLSRARASIRSARSRPPGSSTASRPSRTAPASSRSSSPGSSSPTSRAVQGQIERFHTSLASLAEIAVFVALGLTMDLATFDLGVWLDGLLLASRSPSSSGRSSSRHSSHRSASGSASVFVVWGGLRAPCRSSSRVRRPRRGRRCAPVYGIIFVVVPLRPRPGIEIPVPRPRLGVPMRAGRADEHARFRPRPARGAAALHGLQVSNGSVPSPATAAC